MCGWRSGRESECNKDRHLNRTVYSGHGKRGKDERWLNFRSGGKERQKIGRKS